MKRNKVENCHTKMITSYRRRTHLEEKNKKQNKDREEKLKEHRKEK